MSYGYFPEFLCNCCLLYLCTSENDGCMTQQDRSCESDTMFVSFQTPQLQFMLFVCYFPTGCNHVKTVEAAFSQKCVKARRASLYHSAWTLMCEYFELVLQLQLTCTSVDAACEQLYSGRVVVVSGSPLFTSDFIR